MCFGSPSSGEVACCHGLDHGLPWPGNVDWTGSCKKALQVATWYVVFPLAKTIYDERYTAQVATVPLAKAGLRDKQDRAVSFYSLKPSCHIWPMGLWETHLYCSELPRLRDHLYYRCSTVNLVEEGWLIQNCSHAPNNIWVNDRWHVSPLDYNAAEKIPSA